MNTSRPSRRLTLTVVALLFLAISGAAFGPALAATVTKTSSSTGGCTTCAANDVPVSDGTNLIVSNLAIHAAGLMAKVDNSYSLGSLEGSRFRHLHLAGTVHASALTLRNLTGNRLLRIDTSGAVVAGSLIDDGANVYPTAQDTIDLGVVTTGRIRAIHAATLNSGNITAGSSTLALTGGSSTFNVTTAGVNIVTTTDQYQINADVGFSRQAAGVAIITNGAAGDGSLHRLHVTGAAHVQTSFGTGAHVVAVADNGVAAVENAEVLTGTRSLYFVDCLDANGCTLHLATAGMEPGTQVRIVSISANGSLLVPSVTDVQHVAGSAFTLGANDVISFLVVRNRSGATFYVETSRSNN